VAPLPPRQELTDTGLFHPCLSCPKCSGWSCVGGDTYHSTQFMPVLKHVSSARAFKSTWCCEQGLLFLIFSLLCGPEPVAPPSPKDHTKLRPRAESSLGSGSSEHSDANTKRKSRKSFLSKGTGYGPHVDEHYGLLLKSSRSKALPRDDDGIPAYLELYFEALSSLWASVNQGVQPTARLGDGHQRAVAAMLVKSPILQHASVVLRHAAIEELNARHDSITKVLDFVETAAGHPEACTLLLRPRTLFAPAEQLVHIILGNTGKQTTISTTEYETAQSLVAILEHLAVPCRKFVETSLRVGTVSGEAEEGPVLGVVQRICRMADWLGTLRQRLEPKECQAPPEPLASSSSPRQTANVTTRAMRAKAVKEGKAKASLGIEKKVSEWHRENCVREIPDETILKGFYYSDEAMAAESLTPAAGRMRKLLAQVSSLSTDLPEGIYVRHGESRPDVLKVMIIGPAGTPYEHGLFEFDMFCGSEFPQKPPKMFFWTTGGGHAAFNPNLYPNGKSEHSHFLILS